MTIGIYKLVFNNTNSVYIGQSISIERRFTSHIRLMREQLSSLKLNKAYLTYGIPSLSVIQETEPSLLNDLEEFYIKENNSVIFGFNSCSKAGGVSDLYGENSPCASYTKDVYESIVFMLANTNAPYKEIAEELEVTIPTIKDISRGHSHKYLEEILPIEYKKMIDKLGTRVSRSSSAKDQEIVYPKVVSPDGKVYEVENATQFAKEFNINNGNFFSLLKGNRNSANKWKRA